MPGDGVAGAGIANTGARDTDATGGIMTVIPTLHPARNPTTNTIAKDMVITGITGVVIATRSSVRT